MFFFFNYVYSRRTMQYNSNRCLYLMESYNFNHARLFAENQANLFIEAHVCLEILAVDMI